MALSDDLMQHVRATLYAGASVDDCAVRRAAVASYYAAFHRVGEMSADIVASSSGRHGSAWLRVYRSVDHSRLKNASAAIVRRWMESDDPGQKILSEFAGVIIELQIERHVADYDPRPFRLSFFGAAALFKRLEAVFAVLDQVEEKDLIEFVTHVLFKDRSPT